MAFLWAKDVYQAHKAAPPPSETFRYNMQNACKQPNFFIKHGKFRHLAYMYFVCFEIQYESSKIIQKVFGDIKSSKTSLFFN